MPKAPVLSREAFYTRLRDGSIVMFDWCLVNTSLGAMLEPLQLNQSPTNTRQSTRDLYDGSFTRITEINEDQAYQLMGMSGRQLPVTYNTP